MEVHKSIVAVRQQDVLKSLLEKLSRSIWYGSRSSVWHTKRIHETWKVVKGMSSFNFDLIFDSDLWLHSFFYYKNIFYKNIEAEICEILRIF